MLLAGSLTPYSIRSKFLTDEAAQAKILREFWSDALLEILNELVVALMIIIGVFGLLVVAGLILTNVRDSHISRWIFNRREILFDEESTSKPLRPALSSPLRRSSTGKTVHWADHITNPQLEMREIGFEQQQDICDKQEGVLEWKASPCEPYTATS